MKVQISNVDFIEREYQITFFTQFGKGRGILTNFSEFKPNLYQSLDVEFDIDLAFEQLQFNQSDSLYQISTNDKSVELTGKIEDVESDMIYFRLNQNCLIMIATEQDFSHLNQNFIKINLPIDKLRLTIFGS